MPDIKTRDVVKGTVKAIDKSAVAAERMKDAYVRTKDKAEHTVFAAESSPEEYAADRTLTGTETAAHEAVHGLDKASRKGVKTTKENISKARLVLHLIILARNTNFAFVRSQLLQWFSYSQKVASRKAFMMIAMNFLSFLLLLHLNIVSLNQANSLWNQSISYNSVLKPCVARHR